MSGARFQYLRLSVTARCSLNCVYCRPRGCEGTGGGAELTVSQLRLLVECAAAEGARKVRITGGEPLERQDLEQVVAAVSSVPGIAETAMTTNGIGLAGRARALREAGLDRVNVSLDTLRPERFVLIAGTDGHADVMAGIEEAVRVFATVKTNAVLLRGLNDDEIEELVAFAARTGVRARFIEYYRTNCTSVGQETVPAAEVLVRLERAFGPLVPLPADPLSVETAYRIPSAGNATVGLIASATDPPCAQCAKLRVTSAGVLLPCLFAETGLPLAPLLARGDADGLRASIRQALSIKERGVRRRGVPGAGWQVGG